MTRIYAALLVPCLLMAAACSGKGPAYERAYEQETRRLQDKARAEREEAGRYAAVIHFDLGSSTIKEEGFKELDWFVQKIAVDPTAMVHVRGFADATGGDAINQKISRERAENVYRYLVSRGVARSRIAPLGFSTEFPAEGNETADGRRNNRRVEVTVR